MHTRIKWIIAVLLTIPFTQVGEAQSPPCAGLGMHMGNLYQLSEARTRSISPENFTGEKGKGGMATLKQGTAAHAARELGQGWKVNPFINIASKQTFTLAEIEGPGIIQHIWMTPTGNHRTSILRFYWDDETEPSIEVPVGDFFCQGCGQYTPIVSQAVCVNPGSGFNCYWPMPFGRRCKVTMENIDDKGMRLYYQIDYALAPVGPDAAYMHAQFRRVNPLPYKEVYTIVETIKGKGHYVGTYLAHGANSPGWWGEGEIKFYMDGDTDFPTICGTGEEDYFCGSYGYETRDAQGKSNYTNFTTPYTGFHQIRRPKGDDSLPHRFGQYRWHIVDPIRFSQDLRVTIQSLGWKSEGRYLPLQDDLASVAFWYQREPHASFPALPTKEKLIVK